MNHKINWWKTSFGEEEIQRIARSIRNQNVSQGSVTQEFERALGNFLGVNHVIAVSNGSMALLCALLAAEVSVGDEVILPNRTWIATAHAVKLLGGVPVIIDVEADRPIIDAEQIESAITKHTKAIIPVHMNGRAADMSSIRTIARKYGLSVIEDAAQAIGSRNAMGFLGTQSDMGCFSLSVAKTISTGQGGFVVTDSDHLAERLRAIRTHGVENTKDPAAWVMLGFNFRFTDVLASIGIEQLKRLPERLEQLRNIYHCYENGLRDSPFKIIPVNIEAGEVPVYGEFLVHDREAWIDRLSSKGVETRPFYPDIDAAKYLEVPSRHFPNARNFSKNGLYLPSGPTQSTDIVRSVISTIQEIQKRKV